METIIKYNKPKTGNTLNVTSSSFFSSIGGGGGSSSDVDIDIEDKLLWKESDGDMALVPKQSYNSASGESSIAIGTYTQTMNEGELAIGKFNKAQSGETYFTVGNGESEALRSNLFQVGSANTIVYNNLSGTTSKFYSANINNLSANTGVFNTSITSPQANLSAVTANNINVTNKITTNQLQAVSGYIQTLLSEDITVDNLTVTKAAHFFKLIIDEIKATQGQIIITPANAVIDKVETLTNKYRCYFRATDNDKEITNSFEVNDQVVCQTFNAATGVSYNVSNTYYWRLCVATGTTSTTLDGEIVDCHYIDLSNTDKDTYSNSAPKAGDNVVQLGNRNDTTRQAAIIISAYNQQFLDPTIVAPSIVQYYGINDYNLANHRRNIISKDLNEFRGTFLTSTGDDIEELIEEATSGITAYLHTAWANSADGSVDFTKNPQGGSYSYVGFCSNNTESDTSLVYTDYEWSYIKGQKGDTGNKGDKGDKGDTGASGATGEDAEFYKLVPNVEKAIVDKNGTLGVQFQYQIAHVSGDVVTTVTAQTNNYWVRFKGDNSNTYYNLSTGTTTPSYTNNSFQTNYHKASSKPTYFTVYLVSGSSNPKIVDEAIVNVIFEAGATLQITDEINATVQGHSDEIDALSGTVTSHTNSIANLNIQYSAITQTVESNTNNIDALSGTVTSHTSSISQLQQTSSSLTSSITTIYGKMAHRNYFSFNRGIKPYNTTCMLYPYGYGFIGWGSQDRIINFGFTEEDQDSDWTLVFDIKASSQVTVYPDFCDVTPDYIYKGTQEQTSTTALTATTSWQTYRVIWDELNSIYLTNASYNGFLDFAKSNTATTIYLRNIALVKGHYPALEFEQKGEEDISYQGGSQPFSWNRHQLTVNGTYKGLTVFENTAHPTSSSAIDMLWYNGFTIKDKTPYTLSFWAKANTTGVKIDSYFYNGSWQLHANKTGVDYNSEDGQCTTELTTEWKHYTVHWMPHVYSTNGTSGQALIKNVLATRLDYNRATANRTATVNFAGVLFQEGWVEDSQGSSSSLIQQTADNILMQVGSCGINIDSQNITLNGDTNVNGTLTLTDEQQGFILAGDGGNTRITPKSIGTYDNFTASTTNTIVVNKTFGQSLPRPADGYDSVEPVFTFTQNFGIVESGAYITLTNQLSSFRKADNLTPLTPDYVISVAYEIYINGTYYSSLTIVNHSLTAATIGSFTMPTKGELKIERNTAVGFRVDDLGDDLYAYASLSYTAALPKQSFTLIGYDGFASNFGTNNNVYFGNGGAYLKYGGYGLNVTPNGIKKLESGSWVPLNYLKVVRTYDSTYTIPEGVDMVVTTSSSNQNVVLPYPSTCAGRSIYVKRNSNGSTYIYAGSTSSTSGNYFLKPNTVNEYDAYFGLDAGLNLFISDGSHWIRGKQD